jgi:hypothetical protein
MKVNNPSSPPLKKGGLGGFDRLGLSKLVIEAYWGFACLPVGREFVNGDLRG